MRLIERLISFLRAENGAITVDWVILAAFVVGLVVALMVSLGGATADYSALIPETITSRAIPSY